MNLCTFSKSRSALRLAECPLRLDPDEGKWCGCRRLVKIITGRGRQATECCYPLKAGGQRIVSPPDYCDSVRKVAAFNRGWKSTSGTHQEESEKPKDQIMTTEPSPSNSPPSGRFQKAVRKKRKLRMAFDGPSGSGKSVTALRCAHALGKRIAVIDTEAGSANIYIGESFDDVSFDFDMIELTSFAPTEYTSAIEEAGRLGYDAIIVDSLSHAWEGKEGALEMVDRKGGNRFTAWKDVTPMHRRMIDAILTSPAHVICTMRSKVEHVLEKDEKGNTVPRKIGMAPIQRPGMEYEFDIYGSIDQSHIMTVTKSRCRAIDGLTIAKPGAPFMQAVIAWLEQGTVAAPVHVSHKIDDDQLEQIAALAAKMGWHTDRLKRDLPARYGVLELSQLSREQAAGYVKWLEAQYKAYETRKAKTTNMPRQTDAPVSTPTPAPANSSEHANGNGHDKAKSISITEPSNPPVDLNDQPLTDSQRETIKRLFDDWVELWSEELTGEGVPVTEINSKIVAQWRAWLLKYRVESAKQLTRRQATDFAQFLGHRLDCIAMQQESVGVSAKTAGDGADAASKSA
jgi:AAA domain-containing protein